MEVMGLGALNVDNIYQIEHILEDGETVIKESALFPGGSAANTIYGLARLGISTGFTGAIGDDAEGKLLLQSFQKTGVDTSQVKIKSKAKTGSVLCLSDRFGRRSLYVSPGANNFLNLDDLDLTYINQVKILHISSFVDGRQFEILLKLVKKLNSSVKVSFSPGALYTAKGLEVLAPILKRTHVLFLNKREIQQLTGEDIQAGAKCCCQHGCQIVVVTLGKGSSCNSILSVSYIRTAENEYTITPSNQSPTSAADSTGAGDAFATGFLYGLLKGKSLEECGQLGDITALFAIAKTGAREGLPLLNDLKQRYQRLYGKEI